MSYNPSGVVRQLIRDSPGVSDNYLTIESYPGLPGNVVTTVRRSLNGSEWTQQLVDQLKELLSALPGAEVQTYTVRDRITVVWRIAP